jgi:hypothetical protein
MKTYPRSSVPPYNARVLLAEGRQPVTFGGRSGMRRLLSAARHRRHGRPWATARPYYEGLPVVLAARGAEEGRRKPSGSGGASALHPRTEERSRGVKERRRKMSADCLKLSAWSAARRASSLARGRAAFPARGRGSWCAFRRSAPLCLLGDAGLKAYPAPQTIRAIPHGCLILLFDN